jgi:hypothetical protein
MASAADAKPHLDLAQLVSDAIDLHPDANPIRIPALELHIQSIPVAQETRIFPTELPAAAESAQMRVHPGEHDVELMDLSPELPVIAVAILVMPSLPVFLAILIRPIAPRILGLGGSAEGCQAKNGKRGD